MLAYINNPVMRLMTQGAVEAVLKATGDDAAVTVAFNGGDWTPMAAHDRLTVVAWTTRLGLGQAYNEVANATHEPFLVFMHNDCFPPEDGGEWLERLAAAAACFGFAFPEVEEDGVDAAARGIQPTYKGCPPSCCYVVRRDVWGRLGGFDQIYEGCHFEDLDLFMRGIQSRCTMAQVDDVKVFHRRGMTRSVTVDESNAAFKRNADIYQRRWGGIDKARFPGVAKVTRQELLGGETDGRSSDGTTETQ